MLYTAPAEIFVRASPKKRPPAPMKKKIAKGPKHSEKLDPPYAEKSR